MRILVLALALCASLFANAPAWAQTSEAEALARASARGQLIYDFDKAAWVATDALSERYASPAEAGVNGWIVESRAEGGQTVTFYRLGVDGPAAAHVFTVVGGRVIEKRFDLSGDAGATTPVQRRMIEVRSAETPELMRCASAKFNTVIVPPADPAGPTDVYLLTPQTAIEVYPAGGHSLVTYEGTPPKVASSRSFTRGCLDLGTKAQRGAQPAMFFVTHLLDPTPTEIHVFTSLAAQLPVFVSTSSGLWEVSGATIRKSQPAR